MMERGIGYLVCRRDPEGPEEDYQWAIRIEKFLGRLAARLRRYARAMASAIRRR